MRNSILVCTYFYLIKLVQVEGVTYVKGIPTPKFSTRYIPLEKYLENRNWRLAPYGNKEFTKIFKQYREHIRAKYYYVDDNATDTSLGKYVRGLFLTTTVGTTRRPFKKEKIKMANLKLVSENLVELEEKLGITTCTPSTEPTTSTEPYTGVTSRKSASPHFDPHYIEDLNWFLKPLKRLRRHVPENHRLRRYIESKFQNGPRELDGILLLKRAFKEMKANYEQNLQNHIRVRRALGSIVRRSTKRPHLSRNFKAASMKRYRMDARLASEVAAIQGNITIYPAFIHLKKVMDDVEKNNLSTLFYVYNNVAYFGSLPAHLYLTTTTQTSKPVTYVLGKTKVLNIFGDVKKVSPGDVDIPNINLGDKTVVSNIAPSIVSENIQTRQQTLTETVGTETMGTEFTKQKRTRKKKTTNENGEDTEAATKKTRAKRKTSTAENKKSGSGEFTESPYDISLTNKTKERKRKSRSVNFEEKYVDEILTPFFIYLYNLEQVRRKRRNVDDDLIVKKEERSKFDEAPRIENRAESSLNPLGKLKKAIKNSKQNFMSFLKEKKEKIVDMPRRVRYIANEMYLDGKFFVQELKQVPNRIREDMKEKKEYLSLFWDLMKVLMPVTEKGEKGGTTPEPKVVEDPQRYVRNPEDVITPDISDLFSSEPKHSVSSKQIMTSTEKNTIGEISTIDRRVFKEFHRTTTTPNLKTTVAIRKEEDTKKPQDPIILSNDQPVPRHRDSATTLFNKVTEAIILSNFDRPITVHTVCESQAKYFECTYNEQLSAAKPRLVTHSEEHTKSSLSEKTHGIVRKETYNTKIVGPEYVPKNTRRADEAEKETIQQKPTTLPTMEEVFKKVNDKKVFERLETSFKDKDFMNNVFDNVNKDRLSNIANKMNPGDMFKHLNKDTMERMGNLMRDIDPDTLKRMQGLAAEAFKLKTSVPPNNPAIQKNR